MAVNPETHLRSSFLIRRKAHDQLKALADTLGMRSMAELLTMVGESDPAQAYAALQPLKQAWLERSQMKETIADRLAKMTPEQQLALLRSIGDNT